MEHARHRAAHWDGAGPECLYTVPVTLALVEGSSQGRGILLTTGKFRHTEHQGGIWEPLDPPPGADAGLVELVLG